MSAASVPRTEWRPLGLVAPIALVDARLQLHHAAQIIVSAAISFLAARSDDSHTNLEWLPDLRALATNVLIAAGGFRLALRLEDLTLLAIWEGAARAAFPLDGRAEQEALRWMRAELAREGLPAERLTTKKHYEIPPHPVGAGRAYDARDGRALREMANAYHDAWVMTSAVRAVTPDATEPRCWPHHFDLALLITLPPAPDGSAQSIGVGLSPGDDLYAEPYFYVGPYPHPPAESLTALPLGHWHTDGWTGGVLTSSEIAAGGASGQQERTMTYLNAGIAACRRALA
jgi:hypothetical protein